MTGAIPSDYTLNEKTIVTDSSLSNLALLQVKNECVSNFDLDYLKTDMSVRGEVYRKLLPLLDSADEKERKKASLALKFALAALDKREISFD